MFGGLEPDVYFYGERIEKIGEDRYRIHKGGFTTCVQPTPRWDIVSGTATIDLEDYAILRNAVLRVKDVPVFYMPIFYYPIQSDDRATGFLMPSYGNST
jgi:LPS-assembly protein